MHGFKGVALARLIAMWVPGGSEHVQNEVKGQSSIIVPVQ